jgi:hypothetical protein
LPGYSDHNHVFITKEFQFRKIGIIGVASYDRIWFDWLHHPFVRKDAWAIVAASISQSLAIYHVALDTAEITQAEILRVLN